MVKIDYSLRFDVDKIRETIEPNDGYCWVYYDPFGMNIKLRQNGRALLKCYERDTHRPIVVEILDFPSTLWRRTTDPDSGTGMTDAYGKPIVQEVFFNAAERRKWVAAWKRRDDYCSVQIVQNQDPCDELMQLLFWKEAQEESFNKGVQRVFFLDIETEVSSTSLMPWKAVDKMLMITILDSRDWKFHTWSLKPCKPLSENHIVYDQFKDDETAMLRHFLQFWVHNYPDAVCGWNSRWYDMPYIVRRIENVLGSKAAKFISPLEDYRIVHEKSDKKDDNGKWIEKDDIEWVDIKGLFQADEMVLYRDKFGVKPALDGGYGLSNVGKAEGLGAKVAYETTLKDLYLTDWQKFYEYNVRDVDLLAEIEKKCKLIPLARTVAGFGLTNYDFIYQSAPYLVPTISIFCRKHRENVIFNSYANNFRHKEHFEGAWVIPPVPGRYTYGTATVDFNSLYPSCMRMMNLSVETYVGRIEDGYQGEGGLDNFWMQHGGIDGIPPDTKFKIILDGVDRDQPSEREIDVPTLKALLEKRLIICPTNMTLFLKHEVKRGIIADWAEVFFNRRKATKDEKFRCDLASEKTTDPVEKERLMTRVENLGNLQQALKICLNSIYGALATTGCPFMHPIGLAQSVTRAGRFCNFNGRRFYEQWLKENYGIDDNYTVTASGDTDSTEFFTNIDVIEEDDCNVVKIGELYNKCLAKGCSIVNTPSGHELIYPKNLKVRTAGNRFQKVKWLSRHKTPKELVKIVFQKAEPLVVTTDHVCMAYNDDRMLERTASKDLRPGMMVDHYCRESDKEVIDVIVSIENMGHTDDYVYDLEVEDESHVFYANSTLIHNSCFFNLEAVTKDFMQKNGWDRDLNKWTDEQKLTLWNHMQKFTDEYLVPHVQELVAKEFHTSNSAPMRYGLEYMTSGGIFEAKKRYLVHKIVDEGPKIVDKFKYTGISLKRTNTPPEIKEFMKDMYFSAALDSSFGEAEMKSKIDEAYQKMLKMTPNELGIWMGYGAERGMDGFLVAEKGATGVAKCANYYNQIVKRLGLDKKYALINVKDKIQTIYVKTSNMYGIDQIGFPPRQWPKEFDDIFEIDYPKMMKKLLVQPLKGFIDALNIPEMHNYNPSTSASLEYSIDDI